MPCPLSFDGIVVVVVSPGGVTVLLGSSGLVTGLFPDMSLSYSEDNLNGILFFLAYSSAYEFYFPYIIKPLHP